MILVDWPNTEAAERSAAMNREPVRIFGYPITAVLVLSVALAALQATDWRGAAIAAVTTALAGVRGTEALRSRVYSPATAEHLVAKALKVGIEPKKGTGRA